MYNLTVVTSCCVRLVFS